MRLKEPGWQRSAAINAIGTAATGIVLVVVIIAKFTEGAWIVITAMPIIVLFFSAVHRHYERVRLALASGRVRFGEFGRNMVVLVLTDLDAAAAEALGYVRSLRPPELRVLYAGDRPREDVEAKWQEMAPGSPLTFLGTHRQVDSIVEIVRSLPREADDFVTVVIPEMFTSRSLFQAITRPVTFRLKLRLLAEPQVVVTDVPVLAEGGRLVGYDGRPLIPEVVEALVFVASVHDATVRALNYALSLNAHTTRAVFLATEPEETPAFLEAWAARGIDIPLDVVEAPFRDLGPPLIDEVRRVTDQPGAVATVVIPEFLVTRWWHRILHNNRALFIKRQLLFEPRVILSSVPYQLGRSDGTR
jgi:hypothetical protein